MRKIAFATVLLFSLIAPGDRLVSAGARYAGATHVTASSDGSGEVWGALGGTRNTDNSVEFLGCMIQAGVWGTDASCFARDAAGAYGGCYTADPVLVEVIKGMTSDPFLYFTWNAQGRCTSVSITTASYDGPELP
jgi:hypothetical protein